MRISGMALYEKSKVVFRKADEKKSSSSGGAGSRFDTSGGRVGYASGGVSEIRDEKGNVVFTSGGGGSAPSQPVGAATIDEAQTKAATASSASSSSLPNVERVSISSGVAGRLAGADPKDVFSQSQPVSVRGDRNYYVDVDTSRKSIQQKKESSAKPSEMEQISNVVRGEIRAEPEQKSLSERWKRKANELSYEAQFKEKGFSRQSKAAQAVVLSGISEFSKPFVDTANFVKSYFDFGKAVVTRPKETATTIITTTGKEISTEPALFFADLAGSAASFNVIGKLGKLAGKAKFVGKEEIAASQVVEPEVLSKSQKFPYRKTNAAELQKEFQSNKFSDVIKEKTGAGEGGFSASKSKLNTLGGVQAGSSETPGLFIGPSVSTWFLKLKGEGLGWFDPSAEFTLLPKSSQPTINYIQTKVGLIPENIVRGAEKASGAKIGSGGVGNAVASKSQKAVALEEMNKYFTSKDGLAGSGESAITPMYYLGKGEPEAVVGVGSKLGVQRRGNVWDKVTGFKYYTTVDGEKVPIKVITAKSANAASRGSVFQRVGVAAEDVVARRSIASSYTTEKKSVSLLGSGARAGSVVSAKPSMSSSKESSGYTVINSVNDLERAGYSVISGKSAKEIGSLSIGSSNKRTSGTSSSGGVGSVSNRRSGGSSRGGGGVGSLDVFRPKEPSSTPRNPKYTPREPKPRDPEYTPRGYTPRTPEYPPRTNAPWNPGPPRRGSIYSKSDSEDKTFSVLFRRQGKFREVGRGLSAPDAEKLGMRLSKSTLGASYMIKKNGIDVRPSVSDKRFYTKGSVVIEKPKYRLNTTSEVGEINFFRRKKKKAEVI